METTLKHEFEIRGMLDEFDERYSDVGDLASESMLPVFIGEEFVEEIIMCDSISGGADYSNDMPNNLTLTRLAKKGAEKFQASYVQVRLKDLSDIAGIDTRFSEGRLLLAAMAKITTESEKDKTPDQVLSQLAELSGDMFKHDSGMYFKGLKCKYGKHGGTEVTGFVDYVTSDGLFIKWDDSNRPVHYFFTDDDFKYISFEI